MLLPTLTRVTANSYYMAGYIGEPDFSKDEVRLSFVIRTHAYEGFAEVFVHAHGTCHRLERI